MNLVARRAKPSNTRLSVPPSLPQLAEQFGLELLPESSWPEPFIRTVSVSEDVHDLHVSISAVTATGSGKSLEIQASRTSSCLLLPAFKFCSPRLSAELKAI